MPAITKAMVLAVAAAAMALSCKQRTSQPSNIASATMNLAPAKDTSYRDFGALADCSEAPLDYQGLIDLANGIPGAANDRQQALLDELQRQRALQSFTINFASESAQSPGISPEVPGVIRMREDGTLIVRYTCDRNSETYGMFEVIAFDRQQNRFQFASINMNEANQAKRVESNPDLCYGCHDYGGDGRPDLRPNWNMYPEWKGMFGGHDDFFPHGLQAETVNVGHADGWLPPKRQEEEKAFANFVAAKVRPSDGNTPDPCYASLPWLTATPQDPVPKTFDKWPYGIANGSARKRIYATRPNLKLTETMSKMLGLRNYRRIADEPRFPRVETLLAIEAASCTESSYELGGAGEPPLSPDELDKMLAQALTGYVRPKADEAKAVDLRGTAMIHHDPRHPSGRAQALFGVWKAFGWSAGEWTLVPFEYDNPAFETGAGPGENAAFPGDLPLTAYTQQELLERAVARLDDADMAKKFFRARGESADFGEHFSCIDDLAGPTAFATNTDWRTLCGALIEQAKKEGSTRGLEPRTRDLAGSTRGVKPPPVPHFNPKKETLNDYLARVNADLKRRREFNYSK